MANEPTPPSNHKPRKKDDGGSTSKKEEDAFTAWLSNSTVCADLMLSILTELDVEPLIKFKSVCRGWENLITHPEFARWYDAKRSTLESGVVWIGGEPPQMVALGFGCNTKEYDYKAIRIFFFETYPMPTVEVYSSKNDSWQKIDCTFEFQIVEKGDIVNVKGNPYWEVKVNGKKCLLQFDCIENSFNIVREMDEGEMDEGERELTYVEWKGQLACLSSFSAQGSEFIVVSVFDEEDWRIKAKIGPLQGGIQIQNCIQCSKKNRILVLSRDFKFFLVDGENLKNCIHLSELEKQERWPLMILPYNPTVAHIKGMQPLTNKVHEDCEESLTNVIQGFIIGCVREATGEVVCIYVL